MIDVTSDNSHAITMKGTGKVSIETGVTIAGTRTNLPITITADFSQVPEEHHEIYYQAFVYQYRNQAVVYAGMEKVKETECKKSNIDKIVDLVCNPKNWKIKRK